MQLIYTSMNMLKFNWKDFRKSKEYQVIQERNYKIQKKYKNIVKFLKIAFI